MTTMHASAAYLALFLATACPIICRASMAFGEHQSDAACAGEAGGPERDRCPGDEPTPSGPSDPCENLTCFCSHGVMPERAGSEAAVLSMIEAPLSACCPVGTLVACDATDLAPLERCALPLMTAETSAALPLLI